MRDFLTKVFGGNTEYTKKVQAEVRPPPGEKYLFSFPTHNPPICRACDHWESDEDTMTQFDSFFYEHDTGCYEYGGMNWDKINGGWKEETYKRSVDYFYRDEFVKNTGLSLNFRTRAFQNFLSSRNDQLSNYNAFRDSERIYFKTEKDLTLFLLAYG